MVALPEILITSSMLSTAKEIRDSLSIALRKGKGDPLTAKDVKEKLSTLARNDLGYHFLQKIRGSPAFFNKLLYDLLGMIRQLGPCTWFITLSAADLKWTDTIRIISRQQGLNLSDEDIQQLSWDERCKFLRSNPVTAATHFEDRVQLFMKLILLNKKINPLGDILDYKYRIEFQQRGSPHVHMLAWVRNAPTFDSNTTDEVKEFVDQYITCSLPKNDPALYDLLWTVQRHTHSVACRKHGTTCRFHFPRPPLNETIAVKSVETPSAAVKEAYTEALESVQKQLESIEPSEDISLQDILQQSNVSESLYVNALKWVKTKSGQPAVLLKRDVGEVNVNNYNAIMMKSWEANLDVQYVTNVYSCIMYVASYVSKPEKTLGDILKGVSSSSQHLGAKASMKSIAKKFLSHREVSAQEAVYRLMSLPLSKGSREIVFIPTDFPENRTRLFKPMNIINQLEDDDMEVYQSGFLERYPFRPNSIENTCLAEFVAKYKYCSQKRTKEDDEIYDRDLPKQITLKNGKGHMTQRKDPAIIRSHQWSINRQPEQYYHSLLLLYYPWRDEIRDLKGESYAESFEEKTDLIQENRNRYETHAEDVESAIERLEECDSMEDSWIVLAPQTEQSRLDETREGVEVEQSIGNAYDTTSSSHALRDVGQLEYQYELDTEKMTNMEWFDLILSLNTRQYEVHQFIVDWCSRMFLSYVLPKPHPFHIFLTGGAGVGKSHLVRTIVQSVQRLLSRDNQTDTNHILVCAPTGAAAYNISGHTLHSAFLLPIHTRKTDDYIPVSGEKLAALKEVIGSIKVLIIDEISMVGCDILLTVHRRLCDIMGNEEPFGGISILAVGDLLQLPPVAQRPVYAEPSDEMAAIYGSLWKNLSKIVELTEIQRQKNDTLFASLLNRVRIGTHKPEDLEVLNSRYAPQSHEIPSEATHIFAYNKQVNDHNNIKLEEMSCRQFTFNAIDSKKDNQTGQIDTTSFEANYGGLLNTLVLSIGARVMLIKNLDVTDGLVNSATGKVTGFHPPPPDNDAEEYKPKFVLVKFDEERVGKKCRSHHRKQFSDSSTPIPMIESQIRLGKYSKITKKRIQFPLTLSWAVTIHKEQGKTENQLVLSCKGNFQAGQFYTAISRTKTLDGLYLLDQVTDAKVKVNKTSVTEIDRMKSESPFHFIRSKTFETLTPTHLKIISHNINSILPHAQCLEREVDVNCFHVLCFQETWLKPSDIEPQFQNFHCHRVDGCSANSRRKGGLLTYVHKDFILLRSMTLPNIDTQHIILVISPRENLDIRLSIVSIYRNPRIQHKTFMKELETVLQHLPNHLPTIVVGDFNINLLKKQSSTTDIIHLLQYYGLLQYVEAPTHRNGGLLDHIYTNLEPVIIDTVMTYFSDHFMVSIAVPFQMIQ